jgi:hypothetical protein
VTAVSLFQVACQAYLYGLALGATCYAAVAGYSASLSFAAFVVLFFRVQRGAA